MRPARGQRRPQKDAENAEKKDTKNAAKLRKDIEKYRDKAETVDFRDLCQGLLDLLPVPNDED